MQITLSRRRLALAASLVAAVAAAPLAWATVGSKSGTSATAAPAVSAATPTPLVSQAPTSTGDNPYQFADSQTASTSNSCFNLSLPAGVDFALDQVTALSGLGLTSLALNASVKVSSGAWVDSRFSVPVDGSSFAGTRAFDLVVRPDTFGAAAVGDIWRLGWCATSGGGSPLVTFIVTGQKIASGPTAPATADFRATPRGHGVALRWTTGTETELLGFNVWRYRNGKGVKVNATLIRAKRSGEPRGAAYTFLDARPGARRGLTYRLQLVDLQGRRAWYAAFAVPA